MKDLTLNLKQLVSIKIEDKIVNKWYDYRKGVKFLGITIQKEGFHLWGFENTYTPDKVLLENGYLIVDKKVYYKPDITLSFSDGKEYTEKFDTIEEALKSKEEIIKKSGLDINSLIIK